ncbi:unnamed protein product, partial [Mesorhabditis belari]|uniref:Major facilitator superfamily (MFS) profile domain-containing protein n=1 Tax=Mesorhabditis belari TaxID=2138241 RepID=A0AAF3F2J9_9BILA
MSICQQDRRRSFLERLRGNDEDALLNETRKKYCCGVINVEPVLLLITISTGLFATSQQLFTYWARCVELAGEMYPDETNVSSRCALIAADNDTRLQDLVEKDISNARIWLQVAGSLPTILIAPLVGTWSDRSGRKLPLIFSMAGFIFYSIFYLIATLMYERTNIYYWFYASEIVMGFCGGASSLFATMLAIVTDDCRHQLNPGSTMVPLRIGVASAIQSFGGLIGTFVVSLLAVPAIKSIEQHAQSYTHCAFIQCIFMVAALIYTILYVKETHHPQNEPYTTAARFGGYVVRSESETSSEAANRNGGCGKAKGLIDSLIEVMCEPRPGWTRFCLNLSIFFIFVEFLALDAGLLFLLVKRHPFYWTDTQFSIYNVVKGFFFSFGMILGPLLLVKANILGKDSLLIITGSVFSAISFLMLSVATTSNEIYATAFMALFVGVIAPGFRSFLPRMVPKEQTARLLTLIGIVLAFCPIVSALIFNNIFNATIDWWPGFAFLVAGAVQSIAAIGQGVIHHLMKPQWKLDRELREHRRRLGLEENFDEQQQEIVHVQQPGSEERSVSNTAVGSDFQDEDTNHLVT